MDKANQSINNPDELNKILQKTNPLVWITLAVVLILLAMLYAWAFVTTLEIKVPGKADVREQVATVYVDENKADEVQIGQKIYISNEEGTIANVTEDGGFISTPIKLDDGGYDSYIVVKEVRPISFLFGK